MRKKTLIAICFMVLNGSSAFAQFKVDAELRPRFEIRDGYKTMLKSDQKPAYVATQRSRLNFGYSEEKYSIFISVQDARVWGENVSKTDAPSIGLNEAWVNYNFTDKWAMKLGRQSLSYDTKHLIGPNDWNNVGATHDIGLLRYKDEGLKADLGLAFNNNTDKNYESNYPLSQYKYLSFLWVNKKLNDNLSLSVMNIADGNQKKNSNDTIYTRFTSGFHAAMQNDSSLFSFGLSAYYQYGKTPTGKSISAYFLSFSPEFNLSRKLKLILGIDYFSGDDAFSTDSKVNSFSNLYGDGHGLYGYMDYFTTIDSHTDGAGLADIFLRTNYKHSANTSFEFTLHNFSLTNNAIDDISTPGSQLKAKKRLGTEIDLMVKHKMSSSVELRFGYSAMFATRSMELFKDGDHSKYQHWGWVMFVFRPTLFKGDKVINK